MHRTTQLDRNAAYGSNSWRPSTALLAMDIPFQTCDRLRVEFAHRRLPPKIAQAKCHRHGRSWQTRAHSATLGSSPFRYPATPRLRLRGHSVDAMHFLRRPLFHTRRSEHRTRSERRLPASTRYSICGVFLANKTFKTGEESSAMCSLSRRSTATGNTTTRRSQRSRLASPLSTSSVMASLARLAEIPSARQRSWGRYGSWAAPQIAAACALGDILVA